MCLRWKTQTEFREMEDPRWLKRSEPMGFEDQVDRKRGRRKHSPEVFEHGGYQGQGLRESHFWRACGKRSDGLIESQASEEREKRVECLKLGRGFSTDAIGIGEASVGSWHSFTICIYDMLQFFGLTNALVFVSVSKNYTSCHSSRTGKLSFLSKAPCLPWHPVHGQGWEVSAGGERNYTSHGCGWECKSCP